jgi:hypothetical protein
MSESGKVRFERFNLECKIQALTPLSGTTDLSAEHEGDKK